MHLIIRPYRSEDFDPTNHVWRRARVAAFPEFQTRKGHTTEEDRCYFRNVILVENSVLVAEVDGRVIGAGKPGPTTRKLVQKYRELTNSSGEPI